ncbi:MAG: class I SAM-dependent methyltransferase [Rhodospirillales bacterium]|nr:class I SAM-dependent methyltransferase [Rhodospirillales bacterium]
MKRPTDDEKIRELNRVYASNSAEETSAIYDDWSNSYETHMAGAGYAHPAMVAAMLARHQPPTDALVLDAGTGTGIMAQLLIALGYSSLSGFDASEGMLSLAAEKSLYRDLSTGVLGQPLNYDDDAFAATVSSGVFTQGHAPLDGLDELVRITKPGGHIVFSISRTYLGEVFQSKAEDLEIAEKWRMVDHSGRYDSAPLSDEVLTAQVFAFIVS